MQLPDTLTPGQTLEVQLSPFGSYPVYDEDGTKVIQQCDKVAFTNIVQNFTDEVLVDFEHEAEMGGPTTAAAWIQSVRVDDEKGLMAIFKFTDVGAEAIRERRLRFLSPVWLLDNNGRPCELISVGLTNKPNLPVRPILNRAAATVVNVEDQPQQKETETMKEALLELLGLPPETEDAAIIDAVSALKTQVEEQAQAALNNEAEQAADENKEQIQNREAFVEAYKANPTQARQFIACLKKPEAPAPVATNRSFKGATHPDSPLARGNEDIRVANTWKGMSPGSQKDAYLAMNKDAIIRGLEAMN